MSLQSNLKKQIGAIKNAEKQIKTALKSTEKFRNQQLKNVQSLIKKARGLKHAQVVEGAERVRKEIEQKAGEGLELLLAKLNLPTKKEIERLNKRVSSLQKRLEEVETSKKS